MSDLDARYVAARHVLLDVLLALNPHLHAVVVVGAHAVYLRTGDAGIAIAPFTTDADLALEPAILANRPELERLMRDAGLRAPRQQTRSMGGHHNHQWRGSACTGGPHGPRRRCSEGQPPSR